MAVDVMDAIASAQQVRAGTLGARGAVLTGVGAAAFAAIGAYALSLEGSPPPS